MTAAATARLAAVLLLIALGACSTITESSKVTVPYQDRVDRQSSDNFDVSMVALSRADGLEEFGVDMTRWGVQAVWLEITNKTDRLYVLFPAGMDPDYFAPNEVANMIDGRLNRNHQFGAKAMLRELPAGTTRSGFVYVNRDSGAKFLNVDLVTEGHAESFSVLQRVPGLRIDFEQVEAGPRFTDIYAPDERRLVDDATELRDILEALPCCALGGDRKTPGDPLNFVVISDDKRMAKTLILAGWHVTETATASTGLATAWSSLFGMRYPYSPVSPLYLFDRQQDAAFQKSRGTVNVRNHLRLWKSPYRFEGTPVWIGQISRDIGVRLSSRTFVTHKIAPDIDEARFSLLQDLIYARALAGLGWVDGVGAATPEAPRRSYTHDKYYTDGQRAVFVLSDETVEFEEIDFLYDVMRAPLQR